MILVDTSIWIDHLHVGDPRLIELLGQSQVVTHQMVIGELALGRLKDRDLVLGSLAGLSSVVEASHGEVMHLVESKQLFGRGISLVDAHLLASLLLNPGTALWTRDKRLNQAAVDLAVDYIDEAQSL
ncbi:hypothetical protein B0I08_10230 [Glaciihabitans tibetensis]|uniref:PIN domain-containing protein n=1 Tax=Glaciihabitans tibetensis TaxID=1266600 RepID=A0A2T0VGK4_9MICO|nr:type II toxin-antitoxin system VapC family toxin [Glaciihabitans tibetensis]PRY69358.1 hypothetical protein B0I08_10230 [Glaciihabitans tibetensis]